MWRLHSSPHVRGLSPGLGFLPHPPGEQSGKWHVYTVLVLVSVVGVVALMEGCPVQGGSPLRPELPGGAPAPGP